jgi:hypothetical protein
VVIGKNLAYSAFYPVGYWELFHVVKQLELEVDRSLSPSVEVNVWSFTSTYLHDMLLQQ